MSEKKRRTSNKSKKNKQDEVDERLTELIREHDNATRARVERLNNEQIKSLPYEAATWICV